LSHKQSRFLLHPFNTLWGFYSGARRLVCDPFLVNQNNASLTTTRYSSALTFGLNAGYGYLFVFRKFLRKLGRFVRKFRRPIPMYKHFYDPLFVSASNRKKNRFFLFTLFKMKKWSICLDNKTSRVFTTESKLKRNQLKSKRFKKASVIKLLQSNRTSSRRRRRLFKLRKQASQFFESNFKKVSKLFVQQARRNNSFEEVATSFYNSVSFVAYRLGFIGTLSASITAVKCNWFCLDFRLVASYDCLVDFGSVLTLYPNLSVISAFVWYRNFFIRQFFQRTLSMSHYLIAKQPFLVFAFRKKYKTQYIYNKFELIKPFVLKNLKMF